MLPPVLLAVLLLVQLLLLLRVAKVLWASLQLCLMCNHLVITGGNCACVCRALTLLLSQLLHRRLPFCMKLLLLCAAGNAIVAAWLPLCLCKGWCSCKLLWPI
jgi:hypothetical protein